MTTQRIRRLGVITPNVQPDNNTTGNVGKVILLILLIVAIAAGLRWWGERNATQPSTDPLVIEAPANTVRIQVPSGVGVETVKIPTGLAEYPNLTLTVVAGNDGWRITDEDGDKGWCPMKPATLDDLEHCRHEG